MSELYTRFMEWVMPFLQANWQFFFHCNRCTVPVGGNLSLEMGLRSAGRKCAGISGLCFSQLWRKKGIALFKGSAEPSLSYAA